VVHRIDSAHRPLSSLFLNYVRDQSRRTRNHEDSIEAGGVHSQVSQNGADGAVHVDGERFLASANAFSTARAACMCAPSTPASRASSNNRAVRRSLVCERRPNPTCVRLRLSLSRAVLQRIVENVLHVGIGFPENDLFRVQKNRKVLNSFQSFG
jgi:hypothetical protein